LSVLLYNVIPKVGGSVALNQSVQ